MDAGTHVSKPQMAKMVRMKNSGEEWGCGTTRHGWRGEELSCPHLELNMTNSVTSVMEVSSMVRYIYTDAGNVIWPLKKYCNFHGAEQYRNK
jgi:hypothetical protein